MPIELAELAKSKGNDAFKSGNYEVAITHYREAIRHDTRFTVAWCNLGICYKKLQRWEDSAKALNQCLSLDPSYAKAQQNLLDIYQKQLLAWPGLGKSCFHHLQKHQARLLFLTADFKITRNQEYKLLEITRGLQSGGLATHQQVKDLEARVRNAAAELGCRDIKFGIDPLTQMTRQEVTRQIQSDLQQPTGKVGDISDLSQYQQVVYGDVKRAPERPGGNVLIGDDAQVNLVCEDKRLLHEMCLLADKASLRPRTYVLDRTRKDIATIMAEINAKIPACDFYVIKAPNIEAAKGVKIVSKKELRKMVSFFLSEPESAVRNAGLGFEEIMQLSVMMDLYHSSCLLIEEYVCNKPIPFEGKNYDATLRVYFMNSRNKGQVDCRYVKGFWRLPDQTSTKHKDNRSSTIPSYQTEGVHSTALTPADEEGLAKILNEQLAPVIAKAMSIDVFEKFEQEPSEPAKYKMSLLFANTLAGLGLEKAALYCFDYARKLGIVDKEFRILHEQGVALTKFGDYVGALAIFNQVESMIPSEGFDPLYYRRGMVHHYLGNVGLRDQNFARVASDKRVIKFCHDNGIERPQSLDPMRAALQSGECSIM